MRPDPDRDRKREIAATPRGADPLVAWDLTVNDRRLLRSLRISPDEDVPPTRAEDGCA